MWITLAKLRNGHTYFDSAHLLLISIVLCNMNSKENLKIFCWPQTDTRSYQKIVNLVNKFSFKTLLK